MRFKHRALPHRVAQRGLQEGRIVEILTDGKKRSFKVAVKGDRQNTRVLGGRELQRPPKLNPVST